jgi:ABC-type antimicrobial peptide transport system, permease component
VFDLDNWQEIYATLKKHKLRSGLAAFGVIWGVFMLVVLLGVGNGLRNDALGNFGGNTNTVFVWSSSRTQLPYQGFDRNRWIPLRPADAEAIKARIPEVDVVIGINEVGGWQSPQYVVRGDNSGSFTSRGSHPEVLRMQSLQILQGRFFNALDNAELRKVAVIGSKVYETLFEPGENPIGESISIGGVDFQVVGVFHPGTIGEQAMQDAELVMIPNETLRYTFNQIWYYGHIRLIPKPGYSSAVLEEKVMNLLRERHKVHPKDTGVFGSFNTEKVYQQVQGLFTGIAAFSWFVALGTILAGVIGVGNIMLITVKERTREIGLRKALGATAGSIVTMIVQEAVIITAVAGYMGLVLGVLVLELVRSIAQDVPGVRFLALVEIDFKTAITAIVVLVVAGFFASLLPASKAAKVNPIVALQDE